MLSWVQNVNNTLVLQGFDANALHVHLRHPDGFQTLYIAKAKTIQKYGGT